MAVEADPPRMLARAARLTPSNDTFGVRTVATIFGGLDRSDNVSGADRTRMLDVTNRRATGAEK